MSTGIESRSTKFKVLKIVKYSNGKMWSRTARKYGYKGVYPKGHGIPVYQLFIHPNNLGKIVSE